MVRRVLFLLALLCIAGAQPSPRRRSPPRRRSFDDRRRSPPRRRYAPFPPSPSPTPSPTPSPPAPPPCSAHCLTCSVPFTCDVCLSGYTRTFWGCEACASHCSRCEVQGPGSCDRGFCFGAYAWVAGRCEPCSDHCLSCASAGPHDCDIGKCAARYGNDRIGCGPCTSKCRSCQRAGSCASGACDPRHTNDGDKCSPCSSACLSCSHSGPYKCDECEDGFYRNASAFCQPCSQHCRSCHSSAADGCTACSFWHVLRGGRCIPFLESSSMAWMGTSSLLVALLCCGSGLLAKRRCRPRAQGARDVPGASLQLEQNLLPSGGSSAPPSGSLPPSGAWRGYYTYERINRDVCEFQLHFASNGAVSGQGVDDVGTYTISGTLGRDGVVAFRKKYARGSRNHLGLVNEDNEGHTVAYKGRLIGEFLGAGFKGTWAIRNRGTNSDGKFHLWPAMESFASAPPAASFQTFQVSEDSECVICYERAINTCLHPCGHIAMCSQCAGQLPAPRTCPICRTSIQSVLTQPGGRSGAQAMQALRTEPQTI
mmetsp:Transcript_15605/g.36831  ORF Transcript_15605/g.36831 Transcript_15605/m.36831 type:complete len:538 (+) Transcript_15605:28-1641(+)